MRKKEQGFGLAGVFFIVLVIALVGFVVWRVDKADKAIEEAKIDTFAECAAAGNEIMDSFPEQCMANGKTFVNITNFEQCKAMGNPIQESYPERCSVDGQTFTKETESYTDSAGVFSLTYPVSLQLRLSEDCCEGPPADWTKESRPFELFPLEEAGIKSRLWASIGTAEEIQNYRQNWTDNGHPVEQVTINGYQAEKARKVFKGDAEEYADTEYIISHEGKAIFLSYREYHHHDMSGTNYDATDYKDDYESVINSIKFL